MAANAAAAAADDDDDDDGDGDGDDNDVYWPACRCNNNLQLQCIWDLLDSWLLL